MFRKNVVEKTFVATYLLDNGTRKHEDIVAECEYKARKIANVTALKEKTILLSVHEYNTNSTKKG